MNSNNNISEDFDNLGKYAPTLSRIPKVNCFTVPDDYFSELPDAIQADVIALSFPKENPFVAPVHYFDELPLEVEASIAMSGLVKEKEFEIPANYFEELPLEIELGIKTSAFPKENPFEVPVNYFDHLPSMIQDRIIEMNNRQPWYETLLQQLFKPKLALAYASLALLIFFGVKFINTGNTIQNTNTVAMLSQKATISERNSISIDYIDASSLEEAYIGEVQKNNNITSYVEDNVDVSTLIGEINDIE